MYTYTHYEKDKTINEIFEEQAARTPDSIALVFKGNFLTYKELDKKSERLARRLWQENVGPEEIVGIMVRRSFEMIIGILAVLKAGGAYLPIDPEYPEDRIGYMLEDSGAKLLLTQKDLLGKVSFDGQKIDIEDEKNYSDNDCLFVKNRNKAENLAYLIYTSGSTGKPKGVMIENRPVINFIKGMTERIGFSQGKKILALTTISFDIFVLETIVPLLNGLTVVIADENEQKNPKLLAGVIVKNNIDMLQITPSRMQLLVNHENGKACLKNLKEIMVGGEPFPALLLGKLKKLTKARIYNMYGPTETTVWSTVRDLTESDKVDIGKPIANTQIYIIGENENELSSGSAGELCIAGDGLARGYFNKPELTKERFINNPNIENRRMYKTGDLARWLEDGNIECLGRLDNQVKIRGFRIEPEEIEAQILSYKCIDEAVVAAKDAVEGNKYLCAYYVSSEKTDIDELRQFLSQRLPNYMVPSYFVQMDRLPSTPNGKIDRKSLPLPAGLDHTVPENDAGIDLYSISGINPLEAKIIDIYKENSGIDFLNAKGKNLSDFALDSISNMKVMLALETEFDIEFPIEDLSPERFSSIGEIAQYIESMKGVLV